MEIKDNFFRDNGSNMSLSLDGASFRQDNQNVFNNEDDMAGFLVDPED